MTPRGRGRGRVPPGLALPGTRLLLLLVVVVAGGAGGARLPNPQRDPAACGGAERG